MFSPQYGSNSTNTKSHISHNANKSTFSLDPPLAVNVCQLSFNTCLVWHHQGHHQTWQNFSRASEDVVQHLSHAVKYSSWPVSWRLCVKLVEFPLSAGTSSYSKVGPRMQSVLPVAVFQSVFKVDLSFNADKTFQSLRTGCIDGLSWCRYC